MGRKTLAIVSSALTGLLVVGLAWAAAPGTIGGPYVAVCSPNFPTRCILPAADGSIAVTGGGGGGGDVNLTEVNGAATATGHGTAAGSLRVELPTDGTGVVGLNAGSQIVGKVGIDQTTPGTTNGVQLVPGTSGGLAVYTVEPGASDNHVVIKAGAGQVYGIQVFSKHTAAQYMRLYNATTGFNGCNSATNLVWEGIIPGASTGAGFVWTTPNGIAFATGISICVTGAYGNTDTTNATASVLAVNVSYK